MQMIPITYILSNINKSLAFEWIVENLDREKFNLSFILLHSDASALEKYLKHKQIKVINIRYVGKIHLFKAVVQIFYFLKKEKIQVVHCHLFDACVAGLLAAQLAGVPKRIYTRHHSTFHHLYFPRAVTYDKVINFLSTDIVAISENVKMILIKKENVEIKKIHLIHHGFKLNDFRQTDLDNINKLKIKYRTETKFPVIGIISRFVDWKGIQYIIPAFKNLLKSYPNAKLILANANGNYKKHIHHLLKEIPDQNYLEIPFEEDIFSLYQLFDIFIHVPIDPQIEAFGQTYVEALAAGIPSIFTLSGVAPEFIVHHKNACVVPFKDSTAIYDAMLELLNNISLKEKIIREGKIDANKHFHLQQMITRLEKIYE